MKAQTGVDASVGRTDVGDASQGDKMETFACTRLGLDCDFTVSGATREEVMTAAMEHGMSAHADLMAGMTPEQAAEFATKLGEAIQAA
jgi:predicted small metal-binding protein